MNSEEEELSVSEARHPRRESMPCILSSHVRGTYIVDLSRRLRRNRLFVLRTPYQGIASRS